VKSIVDKDKRTVHEIEFQPAGGLKFFRKPDCDPEIAHWDDEFIRQFFGINRANINTWPKRSHFASDFVRSSPAIDFQSLLRLVGV
jgi:hypothetical protein